MIPLVICLNFEVGPWRVEVETILELPNVPAVGTKIHLNSVVVRVAAVEYWLGDKQYTLRVNLIKGHWGSDLPACDDPRHLEAVLSTLGDLDRFEEVEVSRDGHIGAVGDTEKVRAGCVPAASRPRC